MIHQLYPDDCLVHPERIIGWAHDSMVNACVDAYVNVYGPISDDAAGQARYEQLALSVARPCLEDAIAHLEDEGKATFACRVQHRAVSINRLSDVLRPIARSCWPKEQHVSRGAAEAQCRSLIRRGLERNLRLHVYRCPHCTLFHVGH